MRPRGIVAAVLLVSPFVLAACGSSGGQGSSGAPVDQVSFQVRPVLAEQRATAADCASSAPATPAATAKLARICSADRTIVYSLGPASITEADVTAVSESERGGGTGERVANVELDPKGTAAFAAVTEVANRSQAPRNSFAIVVDGAVVSAPAVEQGAITGGLLEISFGDPKQLDAFLAGWPTSKVATVDGSDDQPALTPAAERCEELVRAEPELAVLAGAPGLLSQTFPLDASSGAVVASVIARAFPGANRDAQFVQCSAPLGQAAPSPVEMTCADGSLVLEPGTTWLIDADGHERLLSAKDAAALLAGDDGSPCS